ncbi:MAG: hypothetical protein ACREF4_11600 [Gammaproteobacteria bacterium]
MADATAPRRHTALRFRWRYEDGRGAVTGTGTARIAPPDSMRLDYRAMLGLGSGAAVVVGNTLRWAEPRGQFESWMPAVPLLWTALGTVPRPEPDAAVFRADGPERAVWRYVVGRDTLDFVVTGGAERRLEAEWRQGGAIRARSRTGYDDHAMPADARIDFPEVGARFDLTVVARDTLAVIAPTLWRRR